MCYTDTTRVVNVLMSKKRNTSRPTPPETRNRQKKTFELLIPSVKQAQEILNNEIRPRSMTRLIEDLLSEEHARLFRNRKVAA